MKLKSPDSQMSELKRLNHICFQLLLQSGGSQSLVPRNHAENVLEMQILGPHSGSTESETLGMGPALLNKCLNKS